MNQSFMKEKPVFPTADKHGTSYGNFHACKFLIQHY